MNYFRGKIVIIQLFLALLSSHLSWAAPNNDQLAWDLWKRIANVPPTPAQRAHLKTLLDGGVNLSSAAEQTVLQTDEFINVAVVRFLATLMNRDKIFYGPMRFNDAVTMMLKVIDQNRNVSEFFTTNKAYFLDSTQVPNLPIIDNLLYGVTQLHDPNTKYVANEQLELGFLFNLNMRRVLKEEPVTAYQSATHGHPDYLPTPLDSSQIAGILSTAAMGREAGSGGTNRKYITFTFSHFLCKEPLDYRQSNWATNADVIQNVWPDVSHKISQFPTTCLNCHGGLDPLSRAFSFYNFQNGTFLNVTNRPIDSIHPSIPNGTPVIQAKVQHNVYQGGMTPTSTKWVNNFTADPSFGWKRLSGNNLAELGQMLGTSSAFYSCMTKRAYEQFCKKRATSAAEIALLKRLSEDFEGRLQGNFRKLIAEMVGTGGCL